MRSKLNCLLCFLALALLASAQLDSAQLRVKFGAPLNREVLHVPPGFDLVVDYEASHQVCTLQVPAVMPTDNKIQNSAEMKQKMYTFLADLVPDTMRGKETGRHVLVAGTFSVSAVEYEHVAISETEYAGGGMESTRHSRQRWRGLSLRFERAMEQGNRHRSQSYKRISRRGGLRLTANW
jgi:hypothetical protein